MAESDSPHNELVIVALPREGDLSRSVGAQEKHATLLYLGDNVSDEVVALVQASIQEFFRLNGGRQFTETVSSVTSLGDAGARVWMIDSNEGLRTLRAQLLRAPAIRAIYDTLEQYPNYIPHVTIDYVREGQSLLSDFDENLAKLVRQISFDRIALWNGENHDMVWRLPSYESEMADAAHSMSHAEGGRNLEDILNEMSSEQRSAMNVVVGAALENEDISGDSEIVSLYDSMSTEQKYAIDFVVGGIVTYQDVAHSDEVGDFLAHYGVKGMRWGIRKDRSGGGMGRAILESRGARATAALLKDKTFWKRTAITAGLTAAGVGASFAAPAVLPASVLTSIGQATGIGLSPIAFKTYAEIGSTLITGSGLWASYIGGGTAVAVNLASRGSKAIKSVGPSEKTKAAIGKAVCTCQRNGRKRVESTVRGKGNRNLNHSDDIASAFIAHKVAEESSSTSSSSDKTSGKATKGLSDGKKKFDESKFKRDGRGQFARKNSDIDPIDKLWMSDPEYLMIWALHNTEKKLANVLKAAGKKYGVDDKDDAGLDKLKKIPGAIEDIQQSVVDMYNDYARTNMVSPSAKKRVEVYSKPSATNPFDVGYRIIDHDGPNPHPNVTKQLRKEARYTRAVERAASSPRTGPLFNPEAQLDTSRVRDTSDDGGYSPGASLIEQWLKRFQHSDLESDPTPDVDAFLEHFGVKGMKWGVRKQMDRLSMKGALTKEQYDAQTDKVHKMLTKESDAHEVKVNKILSAADAAHAKVDADFVSGSKGKEKVTTEFLDSYERAHKEIDHKVNQELDKISQTSPEVNQKIYDLVVAKTRSDVTRNRLILAARAALLGLGAGTLAMSDLTDTPEVDDPTSDFLAHYGIKGMRWGFRRQRGPGGTVSETVKTDSDADGGSSSSGHISVDAQRFMQTMSKSPSQMSDRELKEANARAEQLIKYNKLFNNNAQGHSNLQAKVDALKLHKEYRNLKRELAPPSAMSRIVSKVGPAFSAYQTLDKALGGTLSAGINRKLGLTKLSTADKIKAEADLLKARNRLASEQNQSIENRVKGITSRAELAKIYELEKYVLLGDQPSQASATYRDAGKRRRGGEDRSRAAGYPGAGKRRLS